MYLFMYTTYISVTYLQQTQSSQQLTGSRRTCWIKA